MNWRKSLSVRLVLLLLLAQFAAYIVGWSGGIVLGLYGVDNFETSLDELSYARMRRILLASLVTVSGTSARIEPNMQLRDEMQRTPGLLFAVFDYKSWRPFDGSSPRLVAELSHFATLSPIWISFSLDERGKRRPSGFLQAVDLPTGRVAIAVHGAKFSWTDVVSNFWSDLQWLDVYILPAVFISATVTWLAVRHGLAPLRSLSRRAAKIDLSSLNQRLPSADVPAEAAPLVESMNDALERLDAGAGRLRRFIANAAHELRTPVAVLTARLDAPRSQTFVADLQRDAHRIKCTVEQLLATAQLANGKEPVLSEMDIAATAQSVSTDAALIAFQSGRDIEFAAPASPVIIVGHPVAINSILSNLVDNALRAEPERGAVIVKVLENGEVWVIDHGAGICEENRERVFEPFWRKDAGGEGAGLGLAIARETITALGGRIWIEETPGGGATFKVAFRLPA